MDGKNNLICDEPEEIPSLKFTDCLKSSSTPWRSPIRHGSVMMMMPSTPLAWRLIQLNSHSKKNMMTSSKCMFLNDFRSIHPSDEVVVASNYLLTMLQFLMYLQRFVRHSKTDFMK
ncbi:unnamed protein product [Brassica oleracea var. botrytis]